MSTPVLERITLINRHAGHIAVIWHVLGDKVDNGAAKVEQIISCPVENCAIFTKNLSSIHIEVHIFQRTHGVAFRVDQLIVFQFQVQHENPVKTLKWIFVNWYVQ